MAISGINTYSNSLYQWQGQKLASTGTSSSTTSKSISTLFDGTSMTNQISSMVELTKYAMDAMGVDSNSRVTFSQITKYRTQLEREFSEGLKNGLANSGISDLSSFSFSLDATGKISVNGGSAQNRKQAQAWLDANPAIGVEMAASLKSNGVNITGSLDFRLSSIGKMTIVDKTTSNIQAFLDGKADGAESLRNALADNNLTGALPIRLSMENGTLVANMETPEAEAINKVLSENPQLAQALKAELEKNNIEESSISLTLGKEGALQATVHNMDMKDAQAVLDNLGTNGMKIVNGLSSLSIDPNISFTIQVDDSGNIQVISDHPDKDKLQQFFAENPELVKKYRQIETLAGIDDARKAMQISPNAMRKRIQIESMAAWWAGSGSTSSWFGTYASGNLSMLSGLNLNV